MTHQRRLTVVGLGYVGLPLVMEAVRAGLRGDGLDRDDTRVAGLAEGRSHVDDITDSGDELIAIYHSHTKSAPEPSQTDINLATYPDAVYLIVSLADPENPEIRGWWLRDGKVDEERLELG